MIDGSLLGLGGLLVVGQTRAGLSDRMAIGPDVMIIIMIKRISRAPIYRTRWEHREPYNNTNNTHSFWSSDC